MLLSNISDIDRLDKNSVRLINSAKLLNLIEEGGYSCGVSNLHTIRDE
jgi:hypothetical protein